MRVCCWSLCLSLGSRVIWERWIWVCAHLLVVFVTAPRARHHVTKKRPSYFQLFRDFARDGIADFSVRL